MQRKASFKPKAKPQLPEAIPAALPRAEGCTTSDAEMDISFSREAGKTLEQLLQTLTNAPRAAFSKSERNFLKKAALKSRDLEQAETEEEIIATLRNLFKNCLKTWRKDLISRRAQSAKKRNEPISPERPSVTKTIRTNIKILKELLDEGKLVGDDIARIMMEQGEALENCRVRLETGKRPVQKRPKKKRSSSKKPATKKRARAKAIPRNHQPQAVHTTTGLDVFPGGAETNATIRDDVRELRNGRKKALRKKKKKRS